MFTANKNDNLPKTTGQNFHNELNDSIEEVKDDVRYTANKAARKARGLIDTAIDSASDEIDSVKNSVSSQIRSNPLQSSAIALGIGFILGALLSR